MSQSPEDIKRWTAHRKSTAVMDTIRARPRPRKLPRSHDLMVAEVEQWMDDFVSQALLFAGRPCPQSATHASLKPGATRACALR